MLPKDVESLIQIVSVQPENAGLFEALINLLENASDSSIVIDALKLLPVKELKAQHTDLSERVKNMLLNADALEQADNWVKEELVQADDDDAVVSNVVSLKVGTSDGEEVAEAFSDVGSIPDVCMDDVAGLQDVKKQIHRKIIKPFERPGLYERFKRRSGGGILMYGPPGCGKTMLAKAVAGECSAHFHEARSGEILDKYQGVAEKRVIDLFSKARAHTPSVIFFDEIEVLAHRRDYSQSGGLNTVISTLLREMDSVTEKNNGLLFLGATNVPWSIDPAFRRPGRFDRTIFVPPPDKIARQYLLKLLLKGRPTSENINIQDIVQRTSGFSGADLESLIETAVDYAIDDSEGEDDIALISHEHIAEATQEVRPSIGEWLGQAKSFAEYNNQDGQYDDLKKFLKKYG